MENKELMEEFERCSRLIIMDDYQGFVEFVNSSKFKSELIKEFKEEYEEAMDEFKQKEDIEIDIPDEEDYTNEQHIKQELKGEAETKEWYASIQDEEMETTGKLINLALMKDDPKGYDIMKTEHDKAEDVLHKISSALNDCDQEYFPKGYKKIEKMIKEFKSFISFPDLDNELDSMLERFGLGLFDGKLGLIYTCD